MSAQLLVYGATGYTGGLLVHALLDAGVRPLLVGRSEARLAEVGAQFGLCHRVARLDDPSRLAAALRGVDAVLNAAGPFAHTAQPLAEACLRAGVHYLDVSGEAPPIEALAAHDGEARERGVMLMPGIGFDVVPSDCLAAHVARRLPGAHSLAIGISALGFVTPGSARAFLAYAGERVRVRREGALVSVPPGTLERCFDYGEGMRLSSAMSWGDTASAWYTTGIPNITTYFETNPPLRAALTACRLFGPVVASRSWQTLAAASAALLPPGPTPEQRASRRTAIVVEAEDAAGRRTASRFHGPESYEFTRRTAPAIARHVLAGDFEPGFQTPARVYGPDFALRFDDVRRVDLA